MTPRLPGLPSLSAFVLAAVLAVWLGLWGPVNLTTLKEWQTLLASMIAPTIALGAAFVAYRAATMKVDFDREVVTAQRRRTEYNLKSRLLHATVHLLGRTQVVGEMIRSRRFSPDEWVITAEMAKIDSPPEMDEAWMALDLLEADIIGELGSIRILARGLVRLQAKWDQGESWRVGMRHQAAADLMETQKYCEDICKRSNRLATLLSRSIAQIPKP